LFLLFFCLKKKEYLCTEMEKSDKIINIILALVALGLLALCIASVVR